MTDDATVRTLGRAHALALDYLAGVADRPVAPNVDLEALRSALGGPLRQEGVDPAETVEALATAVDPGLVASVGLRDGEGYFTTATQRYSTPTRALVPGPILGITWTAPSAAPP